jgi:hypothetical protein
MSLRTHAQLGTSQRACDSCSTARLSGLWPHAAAPMENTLVHETRQTPRMWLWKGGCQVATGRVSSTVGFPHGAADLPKIGSDVNMGAASIVSCCARVGGFLSSFTGGSPLGYVPATSNPRGTPPGWLCATPGGMSTTSPTVTDRTGPLGPPN